MAAPQLVHCQVDLCEFCCQQNGTGCRTPLHGIQHGSLTAIASALPVGLVCLAAATMHGSLTAIASALLG
jgi:hypothetical protein